ncbi:MAG: hypothetical protein QM640_01700 [Niabella sp.]
MAVDDISFDESWLLANIQATAICTGATDQQVYNQIMNYWDFISAQPNARRHLYHYRYGGGTEYIENVQDLFDANPRIRSRIFGRIHAQMRANPRWDSGSIIGHGRDDGIEPPIRQEDYDADDWLNSNGNIDEVHWRLIGDYNPYDNRETGDGEYYLRETRRDRIRMIRVEITIRDPYTWHPLETRPTQCIHQAMERLKSAGAADYITTGTAVLSMPSVY